MVPSFRDGCYLEEVTYTWSTQILVSIGALAAEDDSVYRPSLISHFWAAAERPDWLNSTIFSVITTDPTRDVSGTTDS